MEAMLAGAGRGYAGYRAGTGGGEETEVSEIGFLDLLHVRSINVIGDIDDGSGLSWDSPSSVTCLHLTA